MKDVVSNQIVFISNYRAVISSHTAVISNECERSLEASRWGDRVVMEFYLLGVVGVFTPVGLIALRLGPNLLEQVSD